MPPSCASNRWIAVAVMVLATSLSFLDRQVLAALAPSLKREFHLSNEGYGWVVAAFSLAYALAAPPMGLAIDRLGLNRGAALAVGLWSLAGTATGLAGGLASLVACRAALGVAEAGGIPASGKAFASYLKPHERAMGTAVNQLGISLGLVAAPLFAGAIAGRFGWRAAFVATGLVGFLWLPLWSGVTRRIPPEAASAAPPATVRRLLRDPRLWGLAVANVLLMTVYSLWMNWTTIYLVTAHALSQAEANRRLAWIPPVFASLGGLCGGWLSMRWARAGAGVQSARMRASLVSAAFLLATAAIPWMPSAGWATALISLSFFWCVAMSANLYAMPLDLFGAARAAFAVSVLTFAYGLMQTFVSPLFGRLIDRYGFEPVCVGTAVLPLAAVGVLQLTRGRS
ncbi:MAG: MFS transporter [Acidobacteria bacterium]|nr:MFS transporter [Acidobacteriota bacterium]